MAVAMAAPAANAGGTPGQGVPKGGQIDANPGSYINDSVGDAKNEPTSGRGHSYANGDILN